MILITLTLIVWMTTALRQISLVTDQGQSLLIFLKITLLAMPNLIAIVAPVALLISALHSLNRLSGDSELIVLSASGSTVWRVMKPYLLLALHRRHLRGLCQCLSGAAIDAGPARLRHQSANRPDCPGAAARQVQLARDAA